MTNGNIIGNRYEIVETVGKGGMAIVYKARCTMLNRYVALKVLRPEFREDKDFISRFKAEAQSAASLSHPNIVSIYDVGQDGDLDYIVMEYVEGVTLKQYIDVQGILPWREAVDYAAQISAGLEHAHKKGIIHKDIKPHNIMITREGTLKITDFGIAKVMSSSTIATGNTTMGSVHYFSPEQARGGYTDYKTDIYSLGVVLYEMVTGHLPFQGDTAIAIAMQHIEKEATPPRELNADIPESLENVIRRAMCKDQNLRYDSVTQMMVDLKKVYTGSPVSYPDPVSDDTTIAPKIKGYETEITIPVGGKKKQSKGSVKKDILGVIAGSLAGILVVVGLFFVGYRFIGHGGGNSEKIQLPDFVNQTVTAAQGMVVNSKIQIVVDKEVESETIAPGKIISQSPKAGKMVNEDAIVKVVVSAGGGEFPMPDLVNKHETKVQELLHEKGLSFTLTPEPSDNIPAGYVVRQVPTSGTYIDGATFVTVYVSSGKEDKLVEVPNLLGLSEDEAKAALLDAGLTWGRLVTATSDKAKGTVIGQSVDPGTKVEEKTAVSLKISEGRKEETPQTPQTPDTPQTPENPSGNGGNPPIVIGPPNAGGAE
ncbi:MAG: Stk1 family PASTA domain-containing Ser/Thr kinase [Ruminococcaceae bacterium]|nr:Stk1 family PASTA domain-containing Ser/Thr kinase [Oscillospiraceae bacterium]